MAIKDVREYFLKVQSQYDEMKADLADFNAAFEAGQITEDRLAEIKDNIAQIEANYERLAYIMYLLRKRKRQSKKQLADDKALAAKLQADKADDKSVLAENKELTVDTVNRLKALTGDIEANPADKPIKQ